MKERKFLSNLWLTLVIAFLFLPIVVLVAFSFNNSSQNIIFTGFSFEWYAKLFENTELIDAFLNTLLIATLSTIISTIIGTTAAVGLKKYNFFGKTLINKLLYIPIVIPEIVIGIALLAFFSLAHVELGVWSVLIAHISFSIPFVITSVRSVLYTLPPTYEEAAADLGAGSWQTFWHVTLPLIGPGIISGALLAFTLSLDDVVVSFFTAGPGTNTLPLYIYSIIKTGITPDVNALITIMLIITIIILLISYQISNRAKRKLQK